MRFEKFAPCAALGDTIARTQAAMASTDLYALLKVDKDVQPPQLKKAYYALARKVHPDKRPGDAQAKADFLALKKAYDILSDPVRRRRYDRTGSVEDDADFAAAYEHYRGIPVSEEDIRATEAEYRHSDEERTDVVEYARKHPGDVARILESIIGSTDDDAERYRAILEDALRAGDLPKKYKKPIAKAVDRSSRWRRPSSRPTPRGSLCMRAPMQMQDTTTTRGSTSRRRRRSRPRAPPRPRTSRPRICSPCSSRRDITRLIASFLSPATPRKGERTTHEEEAAAPKAVEGLAGRFGGQVTTRRSRTPFQNPPPPTAPSPT